MADISKITLPSGNTYEIKDAVARQMIAGGMSFIVAWDGTAAPVVADIPAGVKVVYNETEYTGTLSAETTGEGTHAQPGAFYLVKSSTQQSGSNDVYNEYVPAGETGSKFWEKLGDTQIDLTNVVTGVSLSKQTDVVLGEGTTFTASGTTVGANGTAAAVTGYTNPASDTFVKSVSAETGKNLVTTTVPNVTGNSDVSVPNITSNTSVTANKSTWSFTMGSGSGNTETLIIGGGNGSDVSATNTALGTAATASKVTLGTAKTVATGETSTTGTGDAVVTGVTVGSSASALTGLGTPSTETVLTGVQVTAQPTISVGENDEVTVLTDSTNVNVTKGNA